MTDPAKLAERLVAMCDQVGHPDYSLAEFVAGVREAAAALPDRYAAGIEGFVAVPRSVLQVISDELHRLEQRHGDITERGDWAWKELTVAMLSAPPADNQGGP